MVSSHGFLLSLQALTMVSTIMTNTGVIATQGQAFCPSSSCGHLQDIRSPFRMQGDPQGCGFPEYELVCIDSKAIIHINNGRYFVSSISYSNSTFWVVDANLDNSSCPIPASNQRPYINGLPSEGRTLLDPDTVTWAAFVSCSEMLSDVSSSFLSCCSGIYRLVNCRSTKNSFAYAFTTFFPIVGYIKPSCRYLSMIPLGSRHVKPPDNASYEDIVKFMKNGFSVNFPYRNGWSYHRVINTCLKDANG